MKVVVFLLSTPSSCSQSGLKKLAEDAASNFVARLRLRALILRTGGYHQRIGDRVNSPSHHVDPNLNFNVGFSTCALRVVEHCKITPLAPALFTLAQQAALCQASSSLHSSERLLAFLDDLYVLTTRERALEARDTVVQAVQEGCGIASNEGRTRVYNHAGGEPPSEIAELGADVWRGNKRSSERGVKVLGTPSGHPHFITSWAESRMLTERELLNQLPRLPDLQCAWLLLAMCASPRANHALRTVPPLDIAGYAQAHDDAVWETLQACLGGVASGEADGARKLATLPASLGGLGLTSAVRTAPAAYWAAWADALPVIGEPAPGFGRGMRPPAGRKGRRNDLPP